MKTMNFSFDNKGTGPNNKKSFNIQTNNQLKAYLLNENVFGPTFVAAVGSIWR